MRREDSGTKFNGFMWLQLDDFYPLIQNYKWISSPDVFNYFIAENNGLIKLILSGNQKLGHEANVIVTINKKDTTLNYIEILEHDLLYFTVDNFGDFVQKPSDNDFGYDKAYKFIKYDYSDGFGFISEYLQNLVVSDTQNRLNQIELNQHLVTYNNGSENNEERKYNRRIRGNSFNPLTVISSKYDTEFWKDTDWSNTHYNSGNQKDTKNDWIKSQKPVNFQKLYLHTDREFFFEGDTLWFAAYLVEGQSHVLSDNKCNLYVDVINSNGELVMNELFLIQSGAAAGSVELDIEKVFEGNYTLRAYTDYLKNFGSDAFFTKNFRVLSVRNSMELASGGQMPPVFAKTSSRLPATTVPLVKVNSGGHRTDSSGKAETGPIDLQFLPEGGFLLAGQSNCLAFKAIDANGKGVTVSGRLYDSQNKEVLKFKSIFKGTGKFYFTPKTGEKYSVQLDHFHGSNYKLPEAQSTGAKLKLVTQDEKKLQLIIQAIGITQDLPYHLAGLHRGKALFFMDVTNAELNAVIRVNPGQLGSGINRFVLLDRNMNPVSERLVFQNNVELNMLDVQTGDNSYATREEIQLNIKSPGNMENEAALVSISVIDENYINATGGSENIASYLLLNSELKGNIESPASYFIPDSQLNAQTKLDLLMCTNGWSNYEWNSLLSGDLKFNYEPKFGFDFKGKVKRSIGNNGLDEGFVFFMVKGKRKTQFLDLPLNADGSFEFNEVVFYDSAAVFAQGRNKRNKNTIQFDMNFPDLSPPEIDKNLINSINFNPQIPASIYRQSYLNEIKLREFYPDRRSILIEEIDVEGKNYLETWKTGAIRKGDGPYLLTPQQTAGSPDIIHFLQSKVVGIWPARGGQSITLSPGSGRIDDPEPVFWIDYNLMLTVDDIRNYPIDMFETIEIGSPPMSYFCRGTGGVVLLTTKSGRTLNQTKASLLGGALKNMKGFTRTREFYSPKYSPQNLNSKIPDFRNTLYWNPQVILTSENEIYFNACDNVSRYKVFVEGITETGKVCLGVVEFEVDRY